MARFDELVVSPPRCISCGRDYGPFHAEDVYPRWLRKAFTKGHVQGLLQAGTNFTFMKGVARAPVGRTRNVLELTLDKAVCRSCNTHWMSTLEKRVSRAVGDVIVGRRGVALTSYERDDVARWAIQKSLLMQLAIVQRDLMDEMVYVTHEHLRWLYERRVTRELPPGSAVRLFVNGVPTIGGPSSDAQNFMREGIRVSRYEGWPLRDKPSSGMLFTFTVAILGIQVWLGDIDNGVAKLDARSRHQAFRISCRPSVPSIRPSSDRFNSRETERSSRE